MSTYHVNITALSETFATSAPVYQTIIFNGGDASFSKKLKFSTILTEPLPTGASATLSYKADAETSFTDIVTSNVEGAIRKTGVLNSIGTNLPIFKEITFQIISLGNAVITGLKFGYEELSDDNNI